LVGFWGGSASVECSVAGGETSIISSLNSWGSHGEASEGSEEHNVLHFEDGYVVLFVCFDFGCVID